MELKTRIVTYLSNNTQHYFLELFVSRLIIRKVIHKQCMKGNTNH